MFCNDFLSVLGSSTSVLDTCFKCFIYLQMYVANVSSGCFKSRSSVASFPLLAFCYLAWCHLLFPAMAGHPSPLLFSMLQMF
jgi:hypothetical protein